MSERQIGGKYNLERRIAGGGMGAIWMAHDLSLQRRVALKLMAPTHLSAPAARSQFDREAMAVARLQHPNVVQIYDYGIDGDSPYIVMELLEGEDLEARLVRQGRLPPAAVTVLLNQAARGLSAAHAAGIVHRDLKPANLFLARIDSEEVVKILDFGLARVSRGPGVAPQGRSEHPVGTPRYMSPEQMRGDADVDHRSDLWSLAVVAYRALTGQFPFSAETFSELLRKAAAEPATPPSRLVPELGEHFDAFFAQALSPDRARRFQSARELAAHFSGLTEASRPARAKILVVDDEPDVELLMKQRFRRQLRAGVYELVFARDGEEALEQLRRHPDVEIVLSDINMPRVDGLTLLSRLGEVNPLLKVIMVSAYSDMTNIRAAMNRGAFDFVVKPIDFEDLEATLVKTLKHVADSRRTLRSNEENSLLRLFVNSEVVERLLPMVRGTGLTTSETVSATVAFVDVEDFTPILQQQPPEAALRRLNALFELIVPELTARGGVVDKLLGDAVMAIFRGEGHVGRALDACLAARRRLEAMASRPDASSPQAHGVCIGLDSGEVVCGSIGSRAIGRLDYTVLGDVVNTAARLGAVAGRNQLLISERLWRVVEGRYECAPCGVKTFPGGAPPLATYDVLRDKQPAAVAPTDATASVEIAGGAKPGEPPAWAAKPG